MNKLKKKKVSCLTSSLSSQNGGRLEMNLEVHIVCERRRGKKIKRERKENPQWTLTLFRNSKSQQSAQGWQMRVIIVAGDP